MKKRITLLILGAMIQTFGIVGFPVVAASSVAHAGKPILLLFVVAGLVFVIFQLAMHSDLGFSIWFVFGLAALAVCAHQMLGFFIYPGVMKDVEWMSPEHVWLTLIVFFFLTTVYLVLYGLMKLIGRFLYRKSGLL
jgi:hypothetical protein